MKNWKLSDFLSIYALITWKLQFLFYNYEIQNFLTKPFNLVIFDHCQ